MTSRTCSICTAKPARYVCEDCGASICPECFDPLGWRCKNCHDRSQLTTAVVQKPPAFEAPLVLFLLSFLIIFIGMILMAISGMQRGGVSGSTVILIGPIPIIGGFGPNVGPVTLLALIVTVLALLFFLLSWRRR